MFRLSVFPNGLGHRSGLTLVEISISLLVLGVMIAIVSSMASTIPNLRSTENESEILQGNLRKARNTALLTNSTFYMEFNLDENEYSGYLIDRSSGEPRKEKKIDHSLASSNGIIAMSVGLSGRVETGKITIQFLPDGTAEQLAVYMGEAPLASRTVIMHRYGGFTEIHEGEYPMNLEKEWRENLETF